MDEHTLALLEFPKIIDELAALCVSPEGADALRGQPLHGELADARRWRLQEFSQLALMLRAKLRVAQRL